MTYCLGLLVDDGLLMMADTRTNGGIDNISSYRKLHRLSDGPDREIYIATSGSLSASQRVISRLTEGRGSGREGCLFEAATMTEAAVLVGRAVRSANRELQDALGPDRKAGCTLLLGGRIGTYRPRLFLVYAEGNNIECQREVPFLQIGEIKYGRPILDRVLRPETPLPAAIKVALLSFDSAMRSNLSIALPIDMVAMSPDPAIATVERRIGRDDSYFGELSRRWSMMLSDAAEAMPEPDFLPELARPHPLSLVAARRA